MVSESSVCVFLTNFF